jgi:uncharacterized protein YwqG
MYNNQSIKEEINKHLINEYPKYHTILSDLIKPTIAIREGKKNTVISKFGGIPSLPKNYNIQSNKSLSFICQISTEEIKPYNNYNYFSDEGVLFFLINPNLGYPIKKENFKVLYLNNKEYFSNAIPNISLNPIIFNEVFIEFYLHYNFPSYQNYKILELEEKDVELDDEIEDIQDFINSNNHHFFNNQKCQIFGNPQALQGTVSFHWAINFLNLTHPLSDEELEKVKKTEKEYVLLLQIDLSDIKITNHFGDGILYFGIKKDDLIKKKFDNTELVYQST